MTLAEVVVAMAISGLAIAGIVGGYFFSSVSAEKSALSLAATNWVAGWPEAAAWHPDRAASASTASTATWPPRPAAAASGCGAI